MPPPLSRIFARSQQQCANLKQAMPKTLPVDIPIEEERIPGYKRQNFYHPNPGDTIGRHYLLKAKVGWGSTSTVWLAQRGPTWFKRKKYFAIKIGTNNYYNGEAAKELAMSKYLASGNRNHWGHDLLVTAVDHFTINTPNGPHVCLVFEPMRDPLWLFRQRLPTGKITSTTLPLFKLYIRGMLYALDYLHRDRHVIHTDLKLDNILMTFEHNSVIEQFVQAQAQASGQMPRKVVGDDVIYLSHNNFGDIQEEHLRNVVPKIADFGLSQRGDNDAPLIHPIQPSHCHAPEIWDLLAKQELFVARDDASEYSAAHHLAEMIALIGPVPDVLLQRQRDMRHWCWEPDIPNPQGKICNNAADYFGGPFFDDDGECRYVRRHQQQPATPELTLCAANVAGVFMHDGLIPLHRQLRKEVPDCIDADDRDRFLAFLKRMICWLPEERATAEDLAKDPWLRS
ncbi:hypothetical protein QQS21_010856 [Conoideocrella luteorostrata]|uniref:non-specific serine/threonine protein kinase n=1 Tax=Conoideocrella luteorostrata TaxID=1105319 RepID=A0AAJ0FP21_9HYPO|nr:hypothetical protein QQS21_010856 [Conoideocrella luteorostrata]